MQEPSKDEVPDSIIHAVLAQSSTIPDNTPIVEGNFELDLNIINALYILLIFYSVNLIN